MVTNFLIFAHNRKENLPQSPRYDGLDALCNRSGVFFSAFIYANKTKCIAAKFKKFKKALTALPNETPI